MSTATLVEPTARRATRPVCRHCGAPLLDARAEEAGFCCAGCSYVFRLVHEQGLAGYYRIKDEVTSPADAAVFQPRDYAWLEAAQQDAETAGTNIPELALDVQGIACAGCVWLIERIFQKQPGARDIMVNAQLGTMRLQWVRGVFRAAEFGRALQVLGYLAGPAGATVGEPESRGLAKRIGLCVAFAMNVMLFTLPVYFGMEASFEYAGLFGLLSLAFGTLSLFVGGTYFLGRAVRALREGALHIDLPIAIGILGAYLGSVFGWVAGEERFVYFDFVSGFIVLMLIGRWAQVAAVERNQRRLLKQQPAAQRIRLADGGEVAPDHLVGQERIVIAAGQMLPVESRLVDEKAVFSLASINGEAEPRTFHAGQRVPSGALNAGRGEARLVTQQAWSESLLAQLLTPSTRRGAREVFLEKIVRGYLAGIIIIAVASGVGWWLATHDAAHAWSVVTAVLVVSCPCAVALAFPLADELATLALRRRGVFVRDGGVWSRLNRVRHLIFDKTGTLTLETPVLLNPEVLQSLDAKARSVLLSLVAGNAHPVSQCLLEHLLAAGPLTPAPGEVRETPGYGVELGAWSLGRPAWRAATNSEGHDTELTHAGTVVARFHFSDSARPDAKIELARLADRGLTAHILSGDRREKVARLAAELELPAERALGELSPEAKAAWLETFAPDNALMLGDGVNDSLAFERAMCRGTPVIHRGALEHKADFYYLGRGIGGIRALFEINVVRRRVQRTILVFSVAYNVFAVGLAVAGRMNPLIAAILMPVNSLATLLIVTAGMRPAFRADAPAGKK